MLNVAQDVIVCSPSKRGIVEEAPGVMALPSRWRL
jgi:hypothetical protein